VACWFVPAGGLVWPAVSNADGETDRGTAGGTGGQPSWAGPAVDRPGRDGSGAVSWRARSVWRRAAAVRPRALAAACSSWVWSVLAGGAGLVVRVKPWVSRPPATRRQASW